MTPSRYAVLILAVSIFMMLAVSLWYPTENESSNSVETAQVDSESNVDPEAEEPVAPAVVTAEADLGSITLNEKEKQQLRTLVEIFQSKNDNDPRLDQELRNLSEPLKRALRQEYRRMRPELRNELGTIAFLIAREVKEGRGTLADLEFLKNILLEKPCLSLVDCSQPPKSQTPEEEHLQVVYETTANYPQLMDLRYLRMALEEGGLNPEMQKKAIETLESALKSPNPRVVQEAQKILKALGRV